MKIGYDAKRAFRNNTGIGNYSRFIIEGIGRDYPDDRLMLYTPKLTDNPRMLGIRKMGNVDFRLPPPQGFKGALWRTFGITNHLKADGIDIYHGLSNELPLNIRSAGVPSVVTIHDVIWRRLPYCYKPVDRLVYDYKYGHSARNADRVIAVSERTKLDIVEFYGTDPDKIDVVYQGCDEGFKRMRSHEEKEELRARLGLPRRFVLQVGTVERRKNLELTVRALSSQRPEVKLVVVGRDHYGYKGKVIHIARSLGIADRLIWVEGLPFADLPTLNQMAELVVYPSHYEGFGIPVLEGITSGRPVIAATGSCLEEAGGEGAIYVRPDSPTEMAEAMRGVLEKSIDTATLTALGRRHAARFDLSGVASRVHAIYEKIIGETKTV